MMKVIVNDVVANSTDLKLLTAGMVKGRSVQFEFSSGWSALNKTAVFTNGIETRIVPEYKWAEGNIADIPPEVLKIPHKSVKCGVYGISSKGELVIPTLWADLGKVFPSASPDEYEESVPPTPNTWDDLQNQIGVLSKLQTGNKDNLVNAINELYLDKNAPTPSEGSHTEATGIASHAEGYYTKALGNYSHAEGSRSIASGVQSHAEGAYTEALGESSHAEGNTTKAIGNRSHAEGVGTKASANAAHVEGISTEASGLGAHAEGSNTKAEGSSSHAEGATTTAKGNYSHAEGHGTEASGTPAHAEGAYTKASGAAAHAEGRETEASGEYSHAEGHNTKATGHMSHAEGEDTIARGHCQHVQGVGNLEDTTGEFLHIVGNGWTDEEGNLHRSNAHTIDRSGNAHFLGEVRVGYGKEKLQTESEVMKLLEIAVATLIENPATDPTPLKLTPNDGGIYGITFNPETPNAISTLIINYTEGYYDAVLHFPLGVGISFDVESTDSQNVIMSYGTDGQATPIFSNQLTGSITKQTEQAMYVVKVQPGTTLTISNVQGWVAGAVRPGGDVSITNGIITIKEEVINRIRDEVLSLLESKE